MTNSDPILQTCAPEAGRRLPGARRLRDPPADNDEGRRTVPLHPAGGQDFLPVAHRQVEEIWYIVEGVGEVWRKSDGTEATVRVTRRNVPDDPAESGIPVSQHGHWAIVLPDRDHAAVARSAGGYAG